MVEFKLKRSLVYESKRPVSWSSDGHIAVANANSLTVVSWEGLNSFESEAENAQTSRTDPIPRQIEFSLLYGDQKLQPPIFTQETSGASIYWSPWDLNNAECLLAVVTNDLNCFIYKNTPEDVTYAWKPCYNISEMLLLRNTSEDDQILANSTINKCRISSFSWNLSGLASGKSQYFVTGLQSGDIAIFKKSKESLAINEIINVAENVAIVDIYWNKWFYVKGEKISKLVYLLQDNSIASIKLRYDEVKGEIICGEKTQLKKSDHFVCDNFKVIESGNFGTVIVFTTTKSINIILQSGKEFSYDFDEISEYRILYKEYTNYDEIFAINALCELDRVTNKLNDCVLSVKFDHNGIIESLKNEKSFPVFISFLVKTFKSLSFPKDALIRINGICESALNENFVILYEQYRPTIISLGIISKSTLVAKIIPFVTEDKMSIETILKIKDFSSNYSNWLLEKFIWKDKFQKPLTIDKDIVEKCFAEEIETVLNHDVTASSVAIEIDDFATFLTHSLNNEILYSEICHKLRFFFAIYQFLDSDMSLKFYNKILLILAKTILRCVDDRKLDNVLDEVVFYNMQLLNKVLNNDPGKEIENSVVIELPIMDELTMEFDFSFSENSDLQTIKSKEGIVWERCSLTFLPMIQSKIKTCEICHHNVLNIDAFPEKLVRDSVLLNCLFETIHTCIYCGTNLSSRI